MNSLQDFLQELQRVQRQMNGLTPPIPHFVNGASRPSIFGNMAGVSDYFTVNPKDLLELSGPNAGHNKIRELSTDVNLMEVKVEDIHNDFYRAGDSLLEEANSILQNAQDTALNKKATRLREQGFSNAAEVKAWDKAMANRDAAKVIKNRLTELQARYPLTRFISQDDLDQLCEKYKLVFGPAKDYTGTIPDANLLEIEKARPIQEQDCDASRWNTTNNTRMQANLCIVASPDTMIVRNPSRERFSIPDPIVLQPIRGGFYRIITAWGPEAQDPAVVPSYEN